LAQPQIVRILNIANVLQRYIKHNTNKVHVQAQKLTANG